MKMRLILGLVALSFSYLTTASAAQKERFYPRGCNDKSVQYSGDHVILGATPSDHKYRVFVFKNISYDPISLHYTPPANKFSYSMVSTLQPELWSALLVNEQNFTLTCKSSNDYYGMPYNCSDVIRACELAVSPVMLSSQGEYWITENNHSKGALFRNIRSQGIYP
ncbi:MAG: hypothetical protein CMF50_04425 [Legionellales bacterium]|nr:hypothetical protein [Legionellales bacterium]